MLNCGECLFLVAFLLPGCLGDITHKQGVPGEIRPVGLRKEGLKRNNAMTLRQKQREDHRVREWMPGEFYQSSIKVFFLQ